MATFFMFLSLTEKKNLNVPYVLSLCNSFFAEFFHLKTKMNKVVRDYFTDLKSEKMTY